MIAFSYLLICWACWLTLIIVADFSLENSEAFSRRTFLRDSLSSSEQPRGSSTQSETANTSASWNFSLKAASTDWAWVSIAVWSDFSEFLAAFQIVTYTSPISAGRAAAPFFFLKLGIVFLSFRLSASRAGKITPPRRVISMKNHFKPSWEAEFCC